MKPYDTFLHDWPAEAERSKAPQSNIRASRRKDARTLGFVPLVDEDFLRRCADDTAGAAIADGAFGPGAAIWVGRREVAHMHSPDVLDIRLTRSVIRSERDVLRSDPRVTLRNSSSDWLEFEVTSIEDLDAAADLVAQAIAANLPSAPPGAPPDGRKGGRRFR